MLLKLFTKRQVPSSKKIDEHTQPKSALKLEKRRGEGVGKTIGSLSRVKKLMFP